MINPVRKVQIIAEIGVNHNGDIELGKKLIEAAANAGADAVKTQLYIADNLAAANAVKAGYQKKATGGGNQLEMLKKLELSVVQYMALLSFAKSIGILFFATPFDIESVRALERLECPIFKVPSGEITNLPFLREVSRINKKIYLSTGMSTMDEVRAAIDVLCGEYVASDITLLHCHTQYPTDFPDANLTAMVTLHRETRFPVGYSDHTVGIEAPIAAVALGANVIEKHFTLDKSLPGPDHSASMEPGEFAQMARAIRNIENALGDGNKKPTLSEKDNMAAARKSIVAARIINKGEIITENMITAKRPGTGISPMRWYEVIGSAANRNYGFDEQIDF